MKHIDFLLSFGIIMVGIRTCSFWLQQWQQREYRWDRLKDHLWNTKEGQTKIFNFWFFEGVFPRPQKSFRILLIIIFFGSISGIIITQGISNEFLKTNLWALAIIWERTIFINTAISVFLSKIPVFFAERKLFKAAETRIKKSKNIIRIGITGSFGKSTTKEILKEIIKEAFGGKRVLWNPENENNEIAIARLIQKNKNFFETATKEKPHFLVIEMGAYKKDEIKKACRFVRPHIGIITSIGNQHLSLFGSQRNIQEGKFELAEACQEKIILNAESELLMEIANEKNTTATKIAISTNVIKKIIQKENGIFFETYGEKFFLPWTGKFFIQNVILAMEVARELNIKTETIKTALKKLPPLQRAFSETKHKNEYVIIKDLYSANVNGVLSAITELNRAEGRKIFIGIPLIELGDQAKKEHEKIFHALEKCQAEVFWLKKDFQKEGKKIIKEKFHDGTKQTTREILKNELQKLGKGDAILLESRLPQKIMQLFEE